MIAISLVLAAACVTESNALPQPSNFTLFMRQSEGGPPADHPDSLPGTAFSTNYGVDAAIAAAPVWNFGRSWGREPCYPESAVVLGSDPPKANPGTDMGIPTDPGDDCTSPGPYNGRFSPGNPFPVYVSAVYCDQIPNQPPQWRVGYSIYYVHDAGHRHDWEWMAVVWKQPDTNVDWWDRDSVILSFHKTNRKHSWGDMITIAGDGTDWSEMKTGLNRHHPRVFPDFFKHANFKDTKTKFNTMAADDDMFRSNDWVRLSVADDMHHFDEIPDNWDWDGEKQHPSKLHTELCSK